MDGAELSGLHTSTFNQDVEQIMLVKEEPPEEQSAAMDQQDPEGLHIKAEQEELWTSLEGEQLHLKETDASRFLLTAVSIKSEDDEENPLFSQLHQHQTEDRDVPTSSSADQKTAETGGGAETSSNPHLSPYEQTSDSSETEVSEDDKEEEDVNRNSELSDSELETGDRDNDWNENVQIMLVKEEPPEEQSADVDQQDPEHLHIKEEHEELWTNLEGEKLHLKETDASKFPLTAVSIKSEDDEEKPLFSHLHQQQKEDTDVPTSSSADQKTAETDGRAETSSNPHLSPYEQTSDSSETEVSEDDKKDDHVNLDSEFSDSGPETGDNDWDESRSSQSDVKTINKSFSCPECGEEFLNKWSLCKHVRVTNHSAIMSSGCLVNKKHVSVKKHVDSCKKVQTELKSFICEDCGKTCSTKSNLNIHRLVHTGQKPFVCDLCGQRFNNKANLNTHMKIHTGQKPFVCDLCGQRFRQKASLNSHMSIHTGQRPFACELCGQRFSRKTTLITHKIIHTGQRPFSCQICRQKFRKQTCVNRHMRVHTEQKPFACDLCGQRFRQKTGLNRHMMRHTGHKPFVCDSCGQRFGQQQQLNSHMSVHTGQKPFPCELCGKRFNHKPSLNRHMTVHTGSESCPCQLCGKIFDYKTSLNRHMSIHTGEKPFACELCGKRFGRKTHLNRHMSVHMGQRPSVDKGLA